MRDQRRQNADYYARNRAAELRRVRRRQSDTRDRLRALRDRPCADCGRSFLPHQMDFDHRDPASKAFRLTAGAAMLASRARLDAEVKKCDVVCSNCHRVRTDRRARRRRSTSKGSEEPATVRRRQNWRKQASLLARLKTSPCHDCGRTFPASAMDFDHRDPGAKSYTVSRMIGRAGTATILTEVAKCDIVCSNCHRDRTFRRREAGSTERE